MVFFSSFSLISLASTLKWLNEIYYYYETAGDAGSNSIDTNVLCLDSHPKLQNLKMLSKYAFFVFFYSAVSLMAHLFFSFFWQTVDSLFRGISTQICMLHRISGRLDFYEYPRISTNSALVRLSICNQANVIKSMNKVQFLLLIHTQTHRHTEK